MKPDPETLLPLTPLWYHVLVALADGPLHGYGLIKEIERLSRGTLHPATGTIYVALRRMHEQGLVEKVEAPDAHEDADDRRQYYGVTPHGREVAAAEARRLVAAVDAARSHRIVDEEAISALVENR